MLKFKIEEFSSKNYVLELDFGCRKIITGSFWNEDSIISEYLKNKKVISDEMDVDQTNITNMSENVNEVKSSTLSFLDTDDDKILKVLSEADIIIITQLTELLMLPYLLKKFKIELSKFKIISTEPITQIGKYYLTLRAST